MTISMSEKTVDSGCAVSAVGSAKVHMNEYVVLFRLISTGTLVSWNEVIIQYRSK